ncbi:MAG: DUF1365 domain-containing protein [Pseudomonadota bacterium]|nr:MAG: DUF1365 domain-containing protein [Pseudomonadota bacterium]
MHSALYLGQVRHRRFKPRTHAFAYRLFMVYLDLAELESVFRGRWLWSVCRPAPAWFRRSDYLGDPAIPLDQEVRDRVERETGARPRGPIRVLAHLRYFGLSFNPVTFYYCFDVNDTRVEAIIAEVTNTPWNERHAYVLPANRNEGHANMQRFRFGKVFHVSPFMPMAIDYDWRFSTPGATLNVHMADHHAREKIFDATLTLQRREINGSSLAYVLLVFPLMTAKVVAGIYWQALRLWLKRVPFHTHPKKLAENGGARLAKTR